MLNWIVTGVQVSLVQMLPLIYVLFGIVRIASAQHQVIEFNNTRPIGPDGPWIPITLRPGYPLQYVDFYPTFNASTNWFVASLNCANANQTCLESAQNYYDSTAFSALHNPDLSSMKNSSAVSFTDIYGVTGELLNTTESAGYWHEESIAISDYGDPNWYWAPGLSQVTSTLTNAFFPNGSSYVPLSLFTLDPAEVYLPNDPNNTVTFVSLLNDMYTLSPTRITSMSWGMHIGSYAQKIDGSLVIGGYDQARIIGNPGTFSNSGVNLSSITLGSSTGGFNWTTDILRHDFLSSQGSDSTINSVTGTSNSINVSLVSGAPYLYLPNSVCSSLASVLPISYNAGLNLYTWNTNDTSYKSIVTSPTYMNFTFTDSRNTPLSVNLPFALLNLTLDAPLVQKPTPYFPCSPNNSTFGLGRAFLQGAFVGMNYNSSTFWLAQAPGPNLPAPGSAIKPIETSDMTLAPNPNGPSWEETWREVWFPANGTGAPAVSGIASGDATSSNQLSGGAIAGIVVGMIVFTTLVLLLAMRYRRRMQQSSASSDSMSTCVESTTRSWYKSPRLLSKLGFRKRELLPEVADYGEIKELDTRMLAVEIPAYAGITELPGQGKPAEVRGTPFTVRKKRKRLDEKRQRNRNWYI